MTWLGRELEAELHGAVHMVPCGYCDRGVREAIAEHCWFCGAPLCNDCWRETGHCGHGEACRRDREFSRQAMKKKHAQGLQ